MSKQKKAPKLNDNLATLEVANKVNTLPPESRQLVIRVAATLLARHLKKRELFEQQSDELPRSMSV